MTGKFDFEEGIDLRFFRCAVREVAAMLDGWRQYELISGNAIPALVAYNFFNRKIDYVLMEMEKVTVYLMNDVRNRVQDKKIKSKCHY